MIIVYYMTRCNWERERDGENLNLKPRRRVHRQEGSSWMTFAASSASVVGRIIWFYLRFMLSVEQIRALCAYLCFFFFNVSLHAALSRCSWRAWQNQLVVSMKKKKSTNDSQLSWRVFFFSFFSLFYVLHFTFTLREAKLSLSNLFFVLFCYTHT